MAVDIGEQKYEEKKFEDTEKWIQTALVKTNNDLKQRDERVQMLKKTSHGTYNIDLILAENSLELIKKNIHKYEETANNPYFARIDFREKLRDKESFYIGKFGIVDEEKMEEIVIDWRAPIANLYYSGTFGEASYDTPIGKIDGELLLKRKFQVRDGKIVNIFDEGVNELLVPSSEEGNELVDEFLKINLEENMSRKLKDVVNTIQKEQNDIIRAFKNKPIIIQGSAGSGKTTVALHRLAYLVYTYGDEMNNSNILVVAPNELFLDYISDILPNLGVSNVKQVTFENLCKEILKIKPKLITKDDKLSKIIELTDEEKKKYIMTTSKIKGSASYKIMMDRLLKVVEFEVAETEDIMVDDYVLYSSKEIKKLFRKNLVNLPINKRRTEIEKYFKGKLKNRIKEVEKDIEDKCFFDVKDIKEKQDLSEEERRKRIIEVYDERDALVKRLLKDSKKAIKDFFKSWQEVDAFDCYKRFYSDDAIFQKVTGGQIPSKLSSFMKEGFLSESDNKTLDVDDLSAITYLKLQLNGIDEGSYIHTVIDEAQDYSMMQFEVLRKVSKNNSMTIVGDIGQGIYNYKGINSWENLILKVFDQDATYITLSQSYRSTVEIIEFANKVLEKQNLNITPARPILRHGPKPSLIDITGYEVHDLIDEIVGDIKAAGKETIAVICKDYEECNYVYNELKEESKYEWGIINQENSDFEQELIIIPSYMTKGLEFDGTIIWNCDDKNYGDNDLDKKLLYVTLTRALHMEYILYSQNVTKLID